MYTKIYKQSKLSETFCINKWLKCILHLQNWLIDKETENRQAVIVKDVTYGINEFKLLGRVSRWYSCTLFEVS